MYKTSHVILFDFSFPQLFDSRIPSMIWQPSMLQLKCIINFKNAIFHFCAWYNHYKKAFFDLQLFL